MIGRWTENLDNGGVIDAIFCGFKKAFDTAPHNRLMDLLSYYGINNPVFSWVRDFLELYETTCDGKWLKISGIRRTIRCSVGVGPGANYLRDLYQFYGCQIGEL